VIVSRLGPGQDPAPLLAEAGRYAPAALLAAARHRVRAARTLAGGPLPAGQRVWILTATGNPAAVERSAGEAGLEVAGRSVYRDHHWFGAGEIARERRRAEEARAILLLTAKDAVRWPEGAAREDTAVLEVEWEWVRGGAEVEARVQDGVEAT
jgi:tetraacyldisaccharide-1-P 4'-kinase